MSLEKLALSTACLPPSSVKGISVRRLKPRTEALYHLHLPREVKSIHSSHRLMLFLPLAFPRHLYHRKSRMDRLYHFNLRDPSRSLLHETLHLYLLLYHNPVPLLYLPNRMRLPLRHCRNSMLPLCLSPVRLLYPLNRARLLRLRPLRCHLSTTPHPLRLLPCLEWAGHPHLPRHLRQTATQATHLEFQPQPYQYHLAIVQAC